MPAVEVQKKTPVRRSVPAKTHVQSSSKVDVPVKTEAPVKVKAEAPVKVKAEAPVKVKAETAVKAKADSPVKVSPKVEVNVEVKESTTPVKLQVDAKKKRQRPRVRAYGEIFDQIRSDIDAAYKALKSATSALKSLESAHNREVHNKNSRANTHRTPTTVFDQALVDYFTSRLEPSELTVTRKEPEGKVTVDLSDLDTDKRVHRPDVTQLYTKVFVKHNLRAPDARYILYQQDPELVALLTEGYPETPTPELQEEIQQILDGTFKLSIFNIQRFTSHHLHKVALPPKDTSSEN